MPGLAKIHSPWEMEMIALKWDGLGAESEGNEFGGCIKADLVALLILSVQCLKSAL